MDVFIEQTPLYFSELKAGIENKDWKTAGETAHKIKPTMSFIGAEAAREVLAEIERKSKAMDGTEDVISMFQPMEDALPLLLEELKIERANLLSA